MNAIMDYSYNAKPAIIKSAGDSVDNVTLNYKMFKFFGPEKTIEAPVKL